MLKNLKRRKKYALQIFYRKTLRIVRPEDILIENIKKIDITQTCLLKEGEATRCLHTFGAGDVEHCKNILNNSSYAVAKCKSCLHKTFFFAFNTAGIIELVEKCCKLCYIACNLGWVVILCRTDDFVGV